MENKQTERVPINLSIEDAIKLKSALTIGLGLSGGQDVEIISKVIKRIDKVLNKVKEVENK